MSNESNGIVPSLRESRRSSIMDKSELGSYCNAITLKELCGGASMKIVSDAFIRSSIACLCQ